MPHHELHDQPEVTGEALEAAVAFFQKHLRAVDKGSALIAELAREQPVGTLGMN